MILRFGFHLKENGKSSHDWKSEKDDMGLITISDIMDGLDSVQLDSEKLSVILL